MCSGSEAGSYLRLIDFVYHSTLGLRVTKKKKKVVFVQVIVYGWDRPAEKLKKGDLSASLMIKRLITCFAEFKYACSLSLSLSLLLSHSLALSLSLALFLARSLSLSIYLSRPFARALSLSIYIYNKKKHIYPSISLSLYIYIYIIYIPLSLALYLSPSPSLSRADWPLTSKTSTEALFLALPVHTADYKVFNSNLRILVYLVIYDSG